MVLIQKGLSFGSEEQQGECDINLSIFFKIFVSESNGRIEFQQKFKVWRCYISWELKDKSLESRE